MPVYESYPAEERHNKSAGEELVGYRVRWHVQGDSKLVTAAQLPRPERFKWSEHAIIDVSVLIFRSDIEQKIPSSPVWLHSIYDLTRVVPALAKVVTEKEQKALKGLATQSLRWLLCQLLYEGKVRSDTIIDGVAMAEELVQFPNESHAVRQERLLRYYERIGFRTFDPVQRNSEKANLHGLVSDILREHRTGGNTQVLGFRDWFQYARDHDKLLTVDRLENLRKTGQYTRKNKLTVYAIDQTMLDVADGKADYKPRKPIDLFTIIEQWYDLQPCWRGRYTYPRGKDMAWYCPMKSFYATTIRQADESGIPSDDEPGKSETSHIQGDWSNEREVGCDKDEMNCKKIPAKPYLQWNDGDDAFTRYMLRSDLESMPLIMNDGTEPER